LEIASQFVATVVCELILRDTQLFATKYVRRVTLGFVRTGLEDDPGHVPSHSHSSFFMGSGDDDDDQEYPESEPDVDEADVDNTDVHVATNAVTQTNTAGLAEQIDKVNLT
jgi:hypothetical protein